MSDVRAGAAEHSRERRSTSLLRLSRQLVASVVVVLLTACDADRSAPHVLMDGSDALAPGVELEGISGRVVLTKVKIVRVGEVRAGSLAADCLRGPARGARPTGRLIERIGAASMTVTLRDASGLHACDDSPGRREADRRWCGAVFGRLYGGRLRDPRLSISCKTLDGKLMGFVWVEPDPGARFIAVRQPNFVEVYRTTVGLPVRVSTTVDVNAESSRASLDLSEHDERGRLVLRYRLEAAVSG